MNDNLIKVAWAFYFPYIFSKTKENLFEDRIDICNDHNISDKELQEAIDYLVKENIISIISEEEYRIHFKVENGEKLHSIALKFTDEDRKVLNQILEYIYDKNKEVTMHGQVEDFDTTIERKRIYMFNHLSPNTYDLIVKSVLRGYLTADDEYIFDADIYEFVIE